MRLTDAGVGAHYQHGEVRAVAGQSKNGGLQVFVVSGQVDERDHLGGALADLLGGARLAVVHHLSVDGERNTDDLIFDQNVSVFLLKDN